MKKLEFAHSVIFSEGKVGREVPKVVVAAAVKAMAASVAAAVVANIAALKTMEAAAISRNSSSKATATIHKAPKQKVKMLKKITATTKLRWRGGSGASSRAFHPKYNLCVEKSYFFDLMLQVP